MTDPANEPINILMSLLESKRCDAAYTCALERDGKLFARITTALQADGEWVRVRVTETKEIDGAPVCTVLFVKAVLAAEIKTAIAQGWAMLNTFGPMIGISRDLASRYVALLAEFLRSNLADAP